MGYQSSLCKAIQGQQPVQATAIGIIIQMLVTVGKNPEIYQFHMYHFIANLNVISRRIIFSHKAKNAYCRKQFLDFKLRLYHQQLKILYVANDFIKRFALEQIF